MSRRAILAPLLFFLAVCSVGAGGAGRANGPAARAGERVRTGPRAPQKQTGEGARRQGAGCMSCHMATDSLSMHTSPGVILGCADCHGGNPDVFVAGAPRASPEYHGALDAAHVHPRHPEAWNYPSSAKPPRTYTLLNAESPDLIGFMNPGDYGGARDSWGACHMPVIAAAERSLMATTTMFWAAAAYNNGILPLKHSIVGESYTPDGHAAELLAPQAPSAEMTRRFGLLGKIDPLPAWETVPPGDVFRVFERGGRVISPQFPEIGNPNSTGENQKLDEPGRPDLRQSIRGLATGLRVSIPVLNIPKTRLNDPTMWFLGTNDNPGDYRQSGCAGCHVVYANDRDVQEGGPYAAFGNRGTSLGTDPTIRQGESGHPLQHQMTTAIPTSQCMLCHMHQPNLFLNSMLGYTMWDYETAAPQMWPRKQKYPTDTEMRAALERNPEGAVVRGNWGDPEFSAEVSQLNPKLKDTQFADYHGHVWNFRALFKRDPKSKRRADANNVIP